MYKKLVKIVLPLLLLAVIAALTIAADGSCLTDWLDTL
jgi:hypothetical protein